MSKSLKIGKTTYIIPNQGESPDWGEEITAWAEGVTEALANVQNIGDILPTQVSLVNNQTSETNIPGLKFDVSDVLSFVIDYYIRREYDGGSVVTQTGTIRGDYNGSQVSFDHDFGGDAGITFTAEDTGQFKYTSSDLTNHTTSFIIFRAKTIIQP